MKKIDKIILVLYTIIGIVLIGIGITVEIDYYSSLIFAMGVGLLSGGVIQILRYYHNTKPENIDAYHQKLRQQEIELKDERKVQIRNRAGYITWVGTMFACFIASFAAALVHASSVIVGILSAAALLEYIAATIIYKYLCKKM